MEDMFNRFETADDLQDGFEEEDASEDEHSNLS
jgi:hypothetical protein